MKESFEKKTSVEKEAGYYDIITDFSTNRLQEMTKRLKDKGGAFSIYYVIFKNHFKMKLSLTHHSLPEGMEWGDAEGGTIMVNPQLKIESVTGLSGSLNDPSPEDFPLIKAIIQKYLDSIKK